MLRVERKVLESHIFLLVRELSDGAAFGEYSRELSAGPGSQARAKYGKGKKSKEKRERMSSTSTDCEHT
jgi:hypothetical protein